VPLHLAAIALHRRDRDAYEVISSRWSQTSCRRDAFLRATLGESGDRRRRRKGEERTRRANAGERGRRRRRNGWTEAEMPSGIGKNSRQEKYGGKRRTWRSTISNKEFNISAGMNWRRRHFSRPRASRERQTKIRSPVTPRTPFFSHACTCDARVFLNACPNVSLRLRLYNFFIILPSPFLSLSLSFRARGFRSKNSSFLYSVLGVHFPHQMRRNQSNRPANREIPSVKMPAGRRSG